jgi:hypothetical protein
MRVGAGDPDELGEFDQVRAVDPPRFAIAHVVTSALASVGAFCVSPSRAHAQEAVKKTCPVS